jgi:hypothetical protein
MKRFILAFTFVVLAISAQAQCSMCKATVTNNNGGLNMGAGINDGIIYLMIIPYIILMIFFRKRIVSGFRQLLALWK